MIIINICSSRCEKSEEGEVKYRMEMKMQYHMKRIRYSAK
jgi:hypothetical protein